MCLRLKTYNLFLDSKRIWIVIPTSGVVLYTATIVATSILFDIVISVVKLGHSDRSNRGCGTIPDFFRSETQRSVFQLS